ncbi:MAG: hypothetical protein LBI58_06310 [Tannerellaceae bacterium]|jgi:hypothetical protein|nr:hypothetical protein [Tannerellaceae bacterium]
MKTKVFKILMLCVAMMAAFGITASAQDNDIKKIEGEWTFSMPDLMGGGGDIAGECTIATVDGATKATLMTPMGEMTSTPLKADNGKFVGTLDIPDFELNVAFHFEDSKLMLDLYADFGELPSMELTRK